MADAYKHQVIDDFHHLTHQHNADIKDIMEYSKLNSECADLS